MGCEEEGDVRGGCNRKRKGRRRMRWVRARRRGDQGEEEEARER